MVANLKNSPGYTENPYTPKENSSTGAEETRVVPPAILDQVAVPPPAQVPVGEGFEYDPGAPQQAPQTQDVTGDGLAAVADGLFASFDTPETEEYTSVFDGEDFRDVASISPADPYRSEEGSYQSAIPSILGLETEPSPSSGTSPDSGGGGGGGGIVVGLDMNASGYVGKENPTNFQAVKPEVQKRIRQLSSLFGMPLRVTPHGGKQADARGGGSQHPQGTAVDLYIADYSDAQKQQLVALAVASGARGIGSYSAGDGKGTIHIDFRKGGKNFGNVVEGGIALWHRQKPGVDSPWTTGPSWYTNGIRDGIKMIQFGTNPEEVASMKAVTPGAPSVSPTEAPQQAEAPAVTRGITMADKPSVQAPEAQQTASPEGPSPQQRIDTLQRELFSPKNQSLTLNSAIKKYVPNVDPTKWATENWGPMLEASGYKVDWFTMNLGHVRDIPLEHQATVARAMAEYWGWEVPPG